MLLQIKTKKYLQNTPNFGRKFNTIDKINGKPGEYEKYFMKIEFDSDDDLSLNKILKLSNNSC